jgi:allantoicase
MYSGDEKLINVQMSRASVHPWSVVSSGRRGMLCSSLPPTIRFFGNMPQELIVNEFLVQKRTAFNGSDENSCILDERVSICKHNCAYILCKHPIHFVVVVGLFLFIFF